MVGVGGLVQHEYDDGISDLDQLNDNETLRLGAFNIQVFGKSKAAKPEVMEVLGKIIRTYCLSNLVFRQYL